MKKIWLVVISALLMAGVLIAAPLLDGVEIPHVAYGAFKTDLTAGHVTQVTLSQSANMQVERADGTVYTTDNPRRDTFKEELLELGISVKEGTPSPQVSQILGFFLAGALVFGAYKAFSRDKVAATATAKEASEKECTITFEQVAGNPESVGNLQGLVDYLKNPERYSQMGARMPRGVLLYGPPGTGKTLMARALAGEAGVPFLYASGSDFVQMYVGMGAARVRELFKKARKHGKCLVFIDEIDALGRARSGEGDNGERDQTLNALLTEMSGFDSGEGILVVAATNRRDTLDEALLRPGRFDRQIEVGLPDKTAREKILAVVSRQMPLQEVCLTELAARTVGFSGAALESMMNEAAILAAREQSPCITLAHVDLAYKTCLVGEEKEVAMDPRDRRMTALHESGHALVCRILLPQDTLQHVTIIPGTKGSGGHMLRIPQERMATKAMLRASVCVALAGRAAEETEYGTEGVSAGASNDIEMATRMLSHMICRLGMDEEAGLVAQSEGMQSELLKRRMGELYGMTLSLVDEYKDALYALADALEEKETLSGAAVDEIIQRHSGPGEQMRLAI